MRRKNCSLVDNLIKNAKVACVEYRHLELVAVSVRLGEVVSEIRNKLSGRKNENSELVRACQNFLRRTMVNAFVRLEFERKIYSMRS